MQAVQPRRCIEMQDGCKIKMVCTDHAETPSPSHPTPDIQPESEPESEKLSRQRLGYSIALAVFLVFGETITSMLLEALITNSIVAAILIIVGSNAVKNTMFIILISLLVLQGYCR